MRKINEAIQLFDSSDTRSFEEIYNGKEDLFEDVDDIIDPKMKKLFESTYQIGNIQGQKRLNEKMVGIQDLKDEILDEIPGKALRQTKELIDQSGIEEALASLMLEYGVKTNDDAKLLPEKQLKELAAKMLVVAVVADDDALIEKMIMGNSLQESEYDNDRYSYEPEYKKYTHQDKLPKDYKANPDEMKTPNSSVSRKYPRYKTDDKGNVYYLSGETITPKMKQQVIDRAEDAGVIAKGIAAIIGVIGLIGLSIATALAPIAILAHNICRIALQHGGIFATGAEKASTSWNIVGIVIAGIWVAGNIVKKSTKESTVDTRVRTREAGADGKPEMVGDSKSDYNFSGDEGKPSGDGVCDGHNRAGMGGADPCATQGQGRGSSSNARLFNESKVFESIYNEAKKKLKEWTDVAGDEYDYDNIEEALYKYADMNELPVDEVCEQLRWQFPDIDEYVKEYFEDADAKLEDIVESYSDEANQKKKDAEEWQSDSDYDDEDF